MNDFLNAFRKKIEKCWDASTVSPKFLPVNDTKPMSLGQCASTSQVLMDELEKAYPNVALTLAIGDVRKNNEIIIPYHVWLVEVTSTPKENKIIDVTGDQSLRLPEVVYEEVRLLADKGIQYISYQQSHRRAFVHAESKARYAVLKERYDRNR